MKIQHLSDRVMAEYTPPFIYSKEAVFDFLISLRKTSGFRFLYYLLSRHKSSVKIESFDKRETMSLRDIQFISAACDYKGCPVIIGFDFRKKVVYLTMKKKDRFQRREIEEILNLK